MSITPELYAKYHNKMRLIADVKNANALLQWDQETYLPAKGAGFRGQQISTLSEISHRLFSEEELGNILQELLIKDDLSPEQKRNVERTNEDYLKNKKYTSEFVRKLSEQINKTFHAWIGSRKQNSFAVYEKDLEALIQLKREEAEMLGYERHPYNALLDEFEKGATVELLDKTFNNLLPTLKDLLDKILRQLQVDNSFLKQHFPKQQQWIWGMQLIKHLNFDFDAGRQDISEHPFSTSFNRNDVRITTRIDENDFGNMTWSCIHETGHGLYEQGLPEEQYGLPLGEACSYSIHESQSRLWENNVGRSKKFWQYYFPALRKQFPGQFEKVLLEDFYKGINQVQPSFIRTEADELTYHFHVYIRYELEKLLLDKTLSAHDIPSYWNELYKKYLNVNVPDDKKGCLQDVHWSHGSFGYFPTYSLGSFYAAQFFETAKSQIKNLEKEIEKGDTSSLLHWLRQNIHSKGRFFTSEELCREVTGTGLDVNHFINYILHKYVSIYNL
ncbi:MAG TPA: carboxypeptidase M32 [Flavisolibacter sp.]|nr:carboxypeptidase M32 [Flavisolibacter sp.]